MLFLSYAKLKVPRAHKAAFNKVRAAIERDDFYSADVKKLSASGYFRAKLDYDTRLLLRFVEHAGRRACLALEVIEQHAYDRSRFLRGARFDADDAAPALAADAPEIGSELSPLRYLHPTSPEFELLDKPISFDDRQGELFALPLPMILVGCAGSGKTALTLLKLRELRGEILYVTQSAYLAESAATLYFSQGYENSAQNVDFLSYRALLESVELPRGRPVTLHDFSAFFRKHEQSLRFTTAHQLFEEFRGVIGADPVAPLALDAYLNLGVRRSIFGVDQRRAVHALFSKYCAWLNEAALYDSNLVAHAYRTRVDARYDAVVVDEAQDLTNAELALTLGLLRQPNAFLLCGDANQIVHPNFFSWSGVKSLFYSEEQAALTAPIHVLEANYRSSRVVCSVGNTLLRIKNARFGSIDRESTALIRAASDAEGRLTGLVNKDKVLRELNQKTKSSTRVAVVVLSDAHKQEARRRFSTPLVFSVHEAKGLEYDAVILYDLVSSERARFKEICDGVSASDLADEAELRYARARDKGDKSLEAYKFFVNALYVAITRAIDTLYVVETDTAHPLLELLGIRCGEDVSQVAAQSSSLEDWQKEASKLERQGKAEQAAAIRDNVLRLTPVPWPVLEAPEVRQLHEKAFAPGSIFTKAKQRLFEFAAYHELGQLAYDLKYSAGYVPPKSRDVLGPALRERAAGHYTASKPDKVMSEIDRYGLEHRSMFGLTPLMMAADAGSSALVTTLVERGARIDAVDPLGRMPVHFLLRRGFRDAAFARDRLGELFDLLCPTSVDIEVDERRLKLSKSQGEFLALLFLMARFHELYSGARRTRGFTTNHVSDEQLAAFPRSVVPEERRRRTYWNAVLARAEVSSSYRPARKLWRRERNGHYVPSDVKIRVASTDGEERFEPLSELMGVDVIEALSRRHAQIYEEPARRLGSQIS